MIKLKSFSILLLFTLFSTAGLVAQEEMKTEMQTQTEVSDQEVEQFAAAFQKIQVVNQEAQQEMVKAIEEKGLDVQSYTEIQKASQDSNSEVEVSADDLQKYESVTKDIGVIQTKAQETMQAKILESGITVNRYQEIAVLVQKDTKLQQKIQEFMQG